MRRHGERLGEALGLVVDTARPDRVDVAPVRLGLGVHDGIAVDLTGRRQDEARSVGGGEGKGVARPLAPHRQGLERSGQVVGR